MRFKVNLFVFKFIKATFRILNAAFNANVSRVVFTSSMAAIINCGDKNTVLTEVDWCPTDCAVSVYQKSKILAEKAVWEFVEEKHRQNQICFEIAVINPQYIYGILSILKEEMLMVLVLLNNIINIIKE